MNTKNKSAEMLSDTKISSPYYRKDYLEHIGGLQALNEEYSYWIDNKEIEGKIPEGVRGTLYRIGPGRNKIGKQVYGHWFDGDGMVHAFSFTEKGVWYRNRYVRTQKYVNETAQQKILYRGFGSNRKGGVLNNIARLPENAANTNLIWHGGKLLALWEGGRPWQIDPTHLTTVGEYNYQGKLNKLDAFSAHGKISPVDGCFYNHGIGFGLKGPQLTIYKINPQGELIKKVGLPIKIFGFIHDFSFAGDYLVYWIHPLGIKNPVPFLMGKSTFNDCVRYQPNWGMQAIIVRADTLEEVKRINLDPCIIVHTANAWQEGDQLILDVIRYEHFKVNDWLSNVLSEKIVFDQDALLGGELYRYRLGLKSDLYSAEKIKDSLPAEFPQWDLRFSGQKTRYAYHVVTLDRQYGGSIFFNSFQKLDYQLKTVTTKTLPEGQFLSEVVFMPTGEQEGEGYLVATVYHANQHRSDVVIFNAHDDLAEVARIPLQHHVPFGFHGGYTTKAFLPKQPISEIRPKKNS